MGIDEEDESMSLDSKASQLQPPRHETALHTGAATKLSIKKIEGLATKLTAKHIPMTTQMATSMKMTTAMTRGLLNSRQSSFDQARASAIL